MPSKVLHLLGDGNLESVGIARIVAKLAEGLDGSKYRVHALFLGSPGPLIEYLGGAGAIVHNLNWYRGARDPIGAYYFWRWFRSQKFAVVHQHFGARSVRRIIRLSSAARLVVHLHGGVARPFRSIPVEARGADAIIAVSHALARQLPAVKTTVVHAGVESSKECYICEQATAQTATVIGAACRLVPLKGLSNLVQAIALLHLEFPDMRLEIAGTGPQREDLEREVCSLGLAGNIRFLGWQLDLRRIFRGWDIFALPSLEEGLPIAVLEAMAEGLPVIATSVGGLPELVEDGRTGYLVPPSDIAALVRCLRILILDSKRRQEMGAAARARAFEHFSVNRMVEAVTAIYDSLTPQQS